MAASARGMELSNWSDELRSLLRRRLCETGGFVLIGLAAVIAVSLATWSVQDPSLSHATDGPIRNLLGTPGAIGADLLMQLFGLASTVLILPVAVWGWRIASHRPFDREWMRLSFWVASTVFAAGFASCLPNSDHWPLPTGLGGVIGDGVLYLPTLLVGNLSSAGILVAAIVFGACALASIIVATGFGYHHPDSVALDEKWAREAAGPEDDDAERTSISLGWIVHQLLSLKARLKRLVTRRSAQLAPKHSPRRATPPVPVKRNRVEPKLEEAIEDDEVEDEAEEEEDDAEVTIAPAPVAKKPARPKPTKKSGGYQLPELNLLASAKASDRFAPSQESIQECATSLESTLQDFGVRGSIINARPGPVVTLYELEPAPGIKSSRVIGLADDIARSMSALSARVAVVQGRNAIGIELPNEKREKVYFREMLASEEYTETQAKLPLCLGKTIGGEPVVVDLARMPHLLIAGTTGSGKSVAINTMILSLLYRLTPDQCRLIMVDPKMLELSVYDGIPHLLTPVVTDPKKAVVALKWAVREMEERYKKMSKVGVRNIDGFNMRVVEAKAKGETITRTVHTGYDKESGEAIYEKEELELEPLPYIVVIVDEMADLMMVAGKDIEGAVQRLAQMARAAGIHVVLATQRPSVDVITGTIKANFPTRISFQVTSKIDSRTILGEQGAEQLLGQGDMLYMAGGGRISRVHGPFCSDDEVEKVVRHLKSQGAPQYLEAVTASEEEPELDDDGNPVFDASGMGQAGDATDLYQQAVQIVTRDKKASTSYIQRRLQIGYNRAASIMERMEQEGIVGQANHAGKREILVGQEEHAKY
ncbi:DNA translocase FtsK [Rhodoplanes sp. Z2-YC6860]|uniref:DNA translocase FtsK n=1 Tax=Rhodoplanes sp. Z2-YC6860 TaxID=674703 RepID=UPI00078DFDB6|nr:DNA translocase FtsK [Rhodoplanes sp. Z2-YC6860]AMN38677.1 DNA translocase ftsK [Rhodoplanes sp. Z2-YC6860]